MRGKTERTTKLTIRLENRECDIVEADDTTACTKNILTGSYT